MRLELAIHFNRLSVTILNPSSQDQRLWDLENSWGWDSFSFELKAEAGGQFHIRRKPREWTKNGPHYFVLLPGGARAVRFDLNDGWWEMEDLAGLQGEAIAARARLQIDPSPEAEQYGIFVGTLLSEWVVSTPPHGWLPPAS